MDPLRPVDLILAKRAGQEHAPAELTRFIDAYVAGEVPDYQVAAWLMAVCWRGMTDAETAALTQAMARSGDMLDLSGLPHTVDKHSTGGVGDKTTLVLAPLLAAMGGTVAKMSGRGLGHTGGTVDKLESIPGFRSSLSDEEFLAQARAVGVVVTGQSKDLAPADGLLYALRDATGTVESLPLIASSIMSKKIAEGTGALVLDVKFGSGAFMTDRADAVELARVMVQIGTAAGVRTSALVTAMHTPLGRAVGNGLEVAQALEILAGGGPADMVDLTCALAEEALAAVGIHDADVRERLTDGRAMLSYRAMIAAQGGDPDAALPRAAHVHEVRAAGAGRVRWDALGVGRASWLTGAGRSTPGEAVDHSAGVLLRRVEGDEVTAGEVIAEIHAGDESRIPAALAELEAALTLGADSTTDRGPAGVVVHRVSGW
mgnify:CR=1 FL=1